MLCVSIRAAMNKAKAGHGVKFTVLHITASCMVSVGTTSSSTPYSVVRGSAGKRVMEHSFGFRLGKSKRWMAKTFRGTDPDSRSR